MKKYQLRLTISVAAAVFLVGCTSGGAFGPNAFLTLAEEFGASSLGTEENSNSVGSLQEAEIPFRADMSVTLNNNSTFELNVSVAAWVNPGSIRSREQQDALLADGYVELTEQTEIGDAFVLPPGTFVRAGDGLAGATNIRIDPGTTTGTDVTASANTLTMVTPDVLLFFSEPPRSCESVAFYFTEDGFPIDSTRISAVGGIFAGATSTGGRKTLAQIDAYECQPLEPGLFLKSGGGATGANAYLEGQSIQVDFFLFPDDNGYAAHVTIG